MNTHARTIFCILTLLFFVLPAFVHAANPPTLATYTVSNSTIYPSDTSGRATTTTITIGFSEQVKTSLKITDASGVVVRSLYVSSAVTNPKPKIWDGTNDTGAPVGTGVYTILISATSVATNLSMSDSSKTITIASTNSNSGTSDTTDNTSDSTNTAATTTTTTFSLNNTPPEYAPIPILRIVTGGDRTVSSGADTAFIASVYDGNGTKRDDAIISWSFGDGMQKIGASVFHTYYGPGDYVTVVHATSADGGDARAEILVTVKDASIKIASVSARGIALINNDTRTLDLSLWRLSEGGQEFKIPADTKILAGRTVLFPSEIIELPAADSAALLYPGGEVAALYPLISGAKLSAPDVSINTAQVVDPIISVRTNIQSNEKAISAPAAATGIAAAGAALSPISSNDAKPTTTPATGLFHSPWTLGFLGVIVAAGGAFVLL